MISYFLSPPGLYYLIIFIFALSLLVYWKRRPLKRELRRWKAKEMNAGPLKFERQETEDAKQSPGVRFGENSDFSGAKIKGVAGRDIIRGEETSTKQGNGGGVEFNGRNFKNANIENIAGRDLIESESPEKIDDDDAN
jgi:hypothetical protein